MSKMKVQDATKELSRRAAKLLGDVTGVRTAAEKTLAELRKIENGFTQQQEAEREEKRREEQQKALSSQSKAWTMPDDVPVEKAEEKAPVEAAIAKLKETVKNGDTAAIRADTEALEKSFYAISEKLYSQAQAQQGPGAGPDAGAGTGTDGAAGGDNTYYNADFEDKTDK